MLIEEGFFMKQFLVCLRACPNRPISEAIADRIGLQVPLEGDVSIMYFTDKKCGMAQNFAGRAVKEAKKKPDQFTLF